MLNHLFFLLGFCFLLAHEMDAIRCKEWRVLPVTSRMDDEAGYLAFTTLHIPLFMLLFLGLSGGDGLSRVFMVGLDVFFVVHVLLHVLYVGHPEYRFRSVFSWALILGAGVFGALDLAILL